MKALALIPKISSGFLKDFTGSIKQGRVLKAVLLRIADCQAVVEQHHGTVEVESKKNGGSSFIVKLPLTVQY